MKSRQETNFIGMMLLAFVFFLLIGMAMQIDLKGRTIGIDQITGAVSGLEKVSGFAIDTLPTEEDPSEIGGKKFYVYEGEIRVKVTGPDHYVKVIDNKLVFDCALCPPGGNPLSYVHVQGLQEAVPEIMDAHINELKRAVVAFKVTLTDTVLGYKKGYLGRDGLVYSDIKLKNKIEGGDERLPTNIETIMQDYVPVDEYEKEVNHVPRSLTEIGQNLNNGLAIATDVFKFMPEQERRSEDREILAGIRQPASGAAPTREGTTAEAELGAGQSLEAGAGGTPKGEQTFIFLVGSEEFVQKGDDAAAAKKALWEELIKEEINIEPILKGELSPKEAAKLGIIIKQFRGKDVVQYGGTTKFVDATELAKFREIKAKYDLIKKDNSGIPEDILIDLLTKEFEKDTLAINLIGEIAKGIVKVPPSPEERIIPITFQGEVIGYYDGKKRISLEEGNGKLAKIALKKREDLKGAQDLGLNENDEVVLKVGDKIHIFDPKTEKFREHSGDYILRKKIDRENGIYIDKTYTNKGKLKTIKASADGGKTFVNIDEATARQIGRNKNRDLKIDIIDGSKKGEKVLKFTKDGFLVEETTVKGFEDPGTGTTTVNKFDIGYFHDGEIISKSEYQKLLKSIQEGKYTGPEPIAMRLIISSGTIETEEGEAISFTTVPTFTIRFSADGSPIQIVEQATFDAEGKLIDYTYKEIYWEKGERKEREDESKAKSAKIAFQSRNIFGFIESALTSYRGLGFYATFFFSDEELDEWREEVDQFFAESILGIEYWESQLCASTIDSDNQGVAYVQTRLGLAAVAAHVEASRSEVALLPPDSNTTKEFLYKITFNVKNGDWDKDPKALEKMRFNVLLIGERKTRLFKEDIVLNKGGQFGVIGANAIVQYSNFVYKQICIVFDDVPFSWSLDKNQLCNIIASPPGKPTIMEVQQAQAQEESPDNSINDF